MCPMNYYIDVSAGFRVPFECLPFINFFYLTWPRTPPTPSFEIYSKIFADRRYYVFFFVLMLLSINFDLLCDGNLITWLQF